MFFASERAELNSLKDQARKILDEKEERPRVLSWNNLCIFGEDLRYAFKLVFEEKEIIFFAMLQWVVICIAYLLWVQILDWIPDSLWGEVKKSVERDDDGPFMFINIALLGWSLLVVFAASYPISILNAAMSAAHYLREAGEHSTVSRCFKFAFKNLGKLWIFTAIDAWITVHAIFDRLPKKRGRRTALEEALYYAWKIGTLGVSPSLIAGNNFRQAATDSIAILKKDTARAIGIRMGYSLICWVIGIAAYIGAVFYFSAFGNHDENQTNEIFNAYFTVAVPIFVAVGVTSVLVRPFFLIMVCNLYTDIIPFKGGIVEAEEGDRFNFPGVLFSVLITVILTLYFFGEQIGFHGWIEHLAQKDSASYQQYLSQKNVKP